MNLYWTCDVAKNEYGKFYSSHQYFFDGHEVTAAEYWTIQNGAVERALEYEAKDWESEMILSHEELERR